MSHDPAFDPTSDPLIPILTEVVIEKSPPAEVHSAALQADDAAPAPASAQTLEERAVTQWTGEEWGVLERRVTERILQQLQGRIDFVLEQRLRDGIAEAVENAMQDLSDEIRTGLQHTLGQVVARAVSQEISHLQTLGK